MVGSISNKPNSGTNSVNERYFDWLPKNKTVFELEKRVITSFNLGEATPLGFFEGLPGDTFNFAANSLIRFASPLVKPAFEKFDVHYSVFTIPLRIILDDFKYIMGERDDYSTKNDADLKIPLIEFTDAQGADIQLSAKHALAYMEVPLPNVADINGQRKLHNITKSLSNAYAMVWNTHFRDQNLQQAKDIDKSDKNIKIIKEGTADFKFHESRPDKYTGSLFSVNRNFDYFSNVFTDTQKGEQTTISLAGKAEVHTGTTRFDVTGDHPATYSHVSDNSVVLNKKLETNSFGQLNPVNSGAGNANTNLTAPSNLYADLSSTSAFNINDLREVEKLQKRKELDLVAGTRYFEIMHNYFNVNNVLAQLDYPQMVAYSKGEISISQVVQTSAQIAGQSTAQGNVAGYGVDVNGHGQVNVTLNEHSIILPIMYITQRHTYQQGTHRFHNRRTKLDFFDPLQIGLGFQAIKKSEIYGHLKDSEQNDVWAYAPANERYRKNTDIISGMLATNATNSISQWHAGDVYASPPTYNSQWKIETPKYLDNILVFPSATVDNFIAEVEFQGIVVKSVDPLGVPFI